ncbi:MAG TPA: thrombospondin type 3 repeat-containing protein, partial [Nitrosopumilaceae archaeon]|nr:thrombospondin type 3 repeat-containing protein [Nitrosopumilaceae archaeon]
MRLKSSLKFWLLVVFTISSIPLYTAFGQTDDHDRDGVPNGEDFCPNLKEDYAGEIDGCPSEHNIPHDSDYDGIADHEDFCPNLRETYNGFEDADGCPDSVGGGASGTPDSDGDSIADNLDACPNQPETYNGILDRDGCPDDYIQPHDSDRDGLPDVIDVCPIEPETYNKFQDEDGCPDTVTSEASSYQFPDADGDGID